MMIKANNLPLCLNRGLAPNGSKVKYMRSPGWFPKLKDQGH